MTNAKNEPGSSKRLLTAAELAPMLGVKTTTVRTWAKRGIIPALRCGLKCVRFDADAVVQAMKVEGKGVMNGES